MYARDMRELSIEHCTDIKVIDVYGSVVLMLAANVRHQGPLTNSVAKTEPRGPFANIV